MSGRDAVFAAAEGRVLAGHDAAGAVGTARGSRVVRAAAERRVRAVDRHRRRPFRR